MKKPSAVPFRFIDFCTRSFGSRSFGSRSFGSRSFGSRSCRKAISVGFEQNIGPQRRESAFLHHFAEDLGPAAFSSAQAVADLSEKIVVTEWDIHSSAHRFMDREDVHLDLTCSSRLVKERGKSRLEFRIF